MSDIFENALDSVRMGLRHYQDEDLGTRDKWAILELFHAIELLVKERLRREHRLLIYRNIDKPLSDDSTTVGLRECLGRFVNLKVEIPGEYVDILLDLQRRRNRIEHHRFVPDTSHRTVLGEALKFIHYFLAEHLDENLEDHLPSEAFEKVKELILGYDELVRRAVNALESERARHAPKDRLMMEVGTCPECGNRTVLVGAGDDNFCYFCADAVVVRQCQVCTEYLPADEFVAGEICHECFSYKVSRD